MPVKSSALVMKKIKSNTLSLTQIPELAQTEKSGTTADPKRLQLQLTGFLEKSAKQFVEDLWKLLIDAQNNPGGIPTAILEAKKNELRRNMPAGKKRTNGADQDKKGVRVRKSRWDKAPAAESSKAAVTSVKRSEEERSVDNDHKRFRVSHNHA